MQDHSATYRLDDEVAAFVADTESFYAAAGNDPGIAERRTRYEAMCRAFQSPYPAGLAIQDGAFSAPDPVRKIPWRRYRPPGSRSDRTVLYLHGGGFVLGGIASHDSSCADLAAASGIALLALDYRLSPEDRYPAALDDVEAAYAGLAADGQRVVVAGDSAGGTLAAALCLRLRRLGKTPPLGQVLIYPALHPAAGRAAGTWRGDVPMLRARDVLEFRRLYTGASGDEPATDPELAPLAAADFSRLPEAAIFAADIDPLAEDSSDYAQALRRAAGTATLHPGEGLVHGYLRGRHRSARIAAAFAAIAVSLRDLAART